MMSGFPKKTCLVTFIALVAQSSLASTWNAFTEAYNDNQLNFFDADTVVKQGETVTVWVKYVKTTKPDSDGSWSSAVRYFFNCKRKTMQVLTASIYDKDGKFMRSYPKPSDISEVVPDSIAEGILKAVCTADFPRNKSGNLYFAVQGNDIYEHTKIYMNYMESKKDLAPK